MAVELRGISKTYGNKIVLQNLNLEIAEGEVFGFLGHNGAGKTTTINILTTLLHPTAGTAKLFGVDIARDSLAARRMIGYLPENVKFYDNLSAYDNLKYFAQLSGIARPHDQIMAALEFLDFAEFAQQRVGEFSKGMRQRVGIAQAILHNPRILFLDEPTSGLDPMGVKTLRDIILRLNGERGITIFMNTHLLSEVSRTCTTIGVLNHGNLIYKDSLAHTLAKFKTEQSLEDIYFAVGHETSRAY
jgi:ABC-2 type transport system ATP-binding protein